MDDFALQLPVHETLVRAAVVYLALVAAVVVGGLAVGGIAANHAGPTDCLIMIVVVLALNYALDRLADRFPAFRRLVRESPTRLVRDGKVLRANLRREMLTEEELLVQLRRQGVDAVADVQEAWLEADGEISVIEKDGGSGGGKGGERHKALR